MSKEVFKCRCKSGYKCPAPIHGKILPIAKRIVVQVVMNQ